MQGHAVNVQKQYDRENIAQAQFYVDTQKAKLQRGIPKDGGS